MNMPDKIPEMLFACCGMNCMACYRHCFPTKPCSGCRSGEVPYKPKHCLNCPIKDCIENRGYQHCYECSDFPCEKIKRLDKTYRTRYKISLIKNSRFVKEKGIPSFLKEQAQKYTCSKCGGIISLHDAQCSECRTKTKR